MSRGVRFTKMQGLGNDFVVFDAVTQSIVLDAGEVRRIADRHFGIGCDQVLVVEKPAQAGVDFRYRIFNADGAEVEQCGNGARCFVQFVRARGLTDKRVIRVETRGGIIEPALEADGQVSVDMGRPRFAPAEIPFLSDSDAVVQPLDVDGRRVSITAVSMGNPHAVQVVADVDAAPVRTEGPLIEQHARFPDGANAGYMEVVDRANIRLRVWERGAGETLACGTGACAAVVAGIRRGLLDAEVRVATHGGELAIAWAGAGHPVWMTGPAQTVFEGEWEIGFRRAADSATEGKAAATQPTINERNT
ncbi:MAG TPA: diaminopimelate epimerase [Casimicrobiaceae bacterium]